jgi:hypothetical protein
MVARTKMSLTAYFIALQTLIISKRKIVEDFRRWHRIRHENTFKRLLKKVLGEFRDQGDNVEKE